MRQPFQVLVVPYRKIQNGIEYLVMERSDFPAWQFVAGGGEDDESPAAAAARELREEAGVAVVPLPLDALSSIPVLAVCDGFQWGTNHLVLREWAFAADLGNLDVKLSEEHSSAEWLSLDAASERLTWDSNVTAAWEVDQRFRFGMLE